MTHEEPHIVTALTGLCKAKHVKCLVQVGAGDGYEADSVRGSVPCYAVAIEGDTRCASFSSGLDYHYSLIGATNCTVDFFLSEHLGLSSQCKRDAEFKQEKVTLRQRRLDTFCDYHGIVPDALVIDTEGTALDVLEGCGHYLDGIRVIYAECQVPPLRPGMRHVDEVEAFLSVRGFTRHYALPSYGAGCGQGNFTWVRP